MVQASLTLDRTALELPPLVITNTPGRFWLPEDWHGGLGRALRKTHAPLSPHEAGRVLLSVVDDVSELPLTIYAQGASTADLESAKAELDAALGQWVYPLSVAVDGVSNTYSAEIERASWGPFDSGMAAQFMARASVTVPLNP